MTAILRGAAMTAWNVVLLAARWTFLLVGILLWLLATVAWSVVSLARNAARQPGDGLASFLERSAKRRSLS